MQQEYNKLTTETLRHIFEMNRDKRICVLGTSCTGKSYLLEHEGIDGLDMDKEIFPKLSKEEEDYVNQVPWTPEIGKKMDELVRTKLSIEAGKPMFGTVLLDCDLIVYLHIDDELLKERATQRGANFTDVKNMQNQIEKQINESGIRTIVLDV